MNASRGRRSHYAFRKPGCQPITIPKHKPIKKVYVEMVKQIVEVRRIFIVFLEVVLIYGNQCWSYLVPHDIFHEYIDCEYLFVHGF